MVKLYNEQVDPVDDETKKAGEKPDPLSVSLPLPAPIALRKPIQPINIHFNMEWQSLKDQIGRSCSSGRVTSPIQGLLLHLSAGGQELV